MKANVVARAFIRVPPLPEVPLHVATLTIFPRRFYPDPMSCFCFMIGGLMSESESETETSAFSELEEYDGDEAALDDEEEEEEERQLAEQELITKARTVII